MVRVVFGSWRSAALFSMALLVASLACAAPALAAESSPRQLIVTLKYDDIAAAAQRQIQGQDEIPNPTPTQEAQQYISLTSAAYEAREAAVTREEPGTRLIEGYGPLPSALVEANGPAARQSLEANPDVLSVIENRSYPLEQAEPETSPGSAPLGSDSLGPTTLEADLEDIDDEPARTSGDLGQGTSVAILDNGAEYIGKSAFGTCPTTGAPGCSVVSYRTFAGKPPDRYGWLVNGASHGSNVAGQALKVAPQAKLVIGNVFGMKNGQLEAEDKSVVAGLEWVMNQVPKRNIKAVNLSLGNHFTYYDEPCGATQTQLTYEAWFTSLQNVDVQPVVAAGNDAYPNGQFRSGVAEPACASPALAVGADYAEPLGEQDGTDSVGHQVSTCKDTETERDQIACFSQGGPLVGVLAPGVKEQAGGYVFSGTSQAAPLVSGAIAALASGSPSSSAAEITAAIESGGAQIKDTRTNETVPRLDVEAAASLLEARALIRGGRIGLGVNKWGDLNVPNQSPSRQGTTTYGLRYLPTNNDFLGPGCPCDGWGIGDPSNAGSVGFADEATGIGGLELAGFYHTASVASSEVVAGDTFRVSHSYTPVPTRPDLYEDEITITNVGTSPVQETLYRRVADWDMEPTAFDEFVTIEASSGATKLRSSTDDGFASPDPLAPEESLGATGNFYRFGPLDQGAQFNFDLGPLAPRGTVSLTEYIGAAPNQTVAYKDLKAIGAQAYSLGEPDLPGAALLGAPNTAILAFTGIGGTRAPLPGR